MSKKKKGVTPPSTNNPVIGDDLFGLSEELFCKLVQAVATSDKDRGKALKAILKNEEEDSRFRKMATVAMTLLLAKKVVNEDDDQQDGLEPVPPDVWKDLLGLSFGGDAENKIEKFLRQHEGESYYNSLRAKARTLLALRSTPLV